VPERAVPETSLERLSGKLRATQTLVSHMSFVWRHPSLIAIEVGWRWLFGIPFLLVVWTEAQRILAQIPPESVGLSRLDWQNPWLDSILLADAFGRYEPAAIAVLRWLAPTAVVAWALVSGLGRTLVLMRMRALEPPSITEGPSLIRVANYATSQALWMLALLSCLWLWYRGVGWACGAYILSGSQPDLVGYLCWLIFLSLGAFTLWALLSWTLATAPLLLSLEQASPGGALLRSFRLGRPLSGKLMEVNLVMAIVKIALIVLALVFSAAPLPFSDEFGPDFMHALYVAIAVGFLIGNDFFHVVRLRSFVELWRHYRGAEDRLLEFASDTRIGRYRSLFEEFESRILEVEVLVVSDDSSLWDFTMEETLEPYYAKIRQVYGVDVEDIEGAILWKILERIDGKR
jgi:hypothetical protein